MHKIRIVAAAGVLALSALIGSAVFAQDKGTPPGAAAPADQQAARDAEAKAAWDAAMIAATKGPADIPFLAQATLKLPEGFAYVPVAPSNRLMRAWGNSAGDDGFVGMVFPADGNEDWFITATYVNAGYVQDKEAKTWDVDALLKSSRDGVEAENPDREARGFPKVKVDGWIEKPVYDDKQHRLVYSMALSAFDAKPGDESSVNYHTYALGREGYISLDLVTGSNNIDAFKERAKTVLAGLQFQSGKRYEDFNSSTDRVAEYGIAALVAGLAAKKLGLLALGGLAIVKFGKLIALAVLGLFGGFARFFRRRPKA